MRKLSSLALAVTISLSMMTVAAFAKDKNHHTVDIPETVKVGAGQLAAGKMHDGVERERADSRGYFSAGGPS